MSFLFLEVGGFVRSEDAFKEVEMRRNALRQATISAGSEKDPPARAALGLKESKQFGVVGQTVGIGGGGAAPLQT